jgi:hypothetical protein
MRNAAARPQEGGCCILSKSGAPHDHLTPEQRQSVERQSRDLATVGAELTPYRSNICGLRHHPVYHEPIAPGEPALPLILGELERKLTAAWFGLLGGITGENAVSAKLAGQVGAMAGAWREWGRRPGLLE